ncbi:MAG: alpha/beta fold hydrolase [Thermoleophilaceae bacterium]
MTAEPNLRHLEVKADGVELSGEQLGDGPPIVLLHGLTATRWYVVLGSKLLARHGFSLISYDARGHGESSAAPSPEAYEYRDLVADLGAVLDDVDAEQVVLAGNSMGAHTAMAFALQFPERLAALVQIGPAYEGRPRERDDELDSWRRLADGLERGGVEGFMEAYTPSVPERWRDTVCKVTRQRLERHRDLRALADAVRVVPGSLAFEGMEELEEMRVPTLVIGSRDEADPGHPLAIAQEYAERLPDAELLVEEEGKSPLAWQGAQLSRAIEDFLERRVPEWAKRRT